MIRRLMRKRAIGPALVVGVLLLCAATASAQNRRPAIQLSGGVFNVGKTPTQAEAGVELRAPIRLWRLDFAGGVAATEEGSYWGYLGLRRDFDASPRLVVALGLAVAGYEQGDGKDLGGSVQFRSSIDFGYRTTDRTRLGLTVHHLSNAGLEEFNPGSNSVLLTYSIDF